MSITLPSARRPSIDPPQCGRVAWRFHEGSLRECCELMDWSEKYSAQVWDSKLEKDLDTGRLDALLAEVDKEYEAGMGQPL